jgi:hypothetical protein
MNINQQTVDTDQTVTVTPIFKDVAGNVIDKPVILELPIWTTDADALVSLQVSQDGLSCVVKPKGPLGVAEITMSANDSLMNVLELTIVAGPAASSILEIKIENNTLTESSVIPAADTYVKTLDSNNQNDSSNAQPILHVNENTSSSAINNTGEANNIIPIVSTPAVESTVITSDKPANTVISSEPTVIMSNPAAVIPSTTVITPTSMSLPVADPVIPVV